MFKILALSVALISASLAPIFSTPASATPITLPAQATNQQAVQYGVAWYPEQRSEDTWAADLALMKAAGFTVVRIAEFSWSKLEPVEGRYDFIWLDRAIRAAQASGFNVVLGTPTAAPPAWLTQKYPDVLAMDERGQRLRHGQRRQFSVNSARYRTLARGIASAMATRYGNNPAIIGFQIDNEYGRATFDPESRAAFQAWLRTKYRTLNALNTAWYTSAWSQTYNDWTQINIPVAGDNPGLALDYYRFFSESWRSYQQVQLDAIRAHLGPNKFVTTNYTGKYDNFDFALTAKPLDLVSWGWYFEAPDLDPAEGGLLHDINRGWLNRNVWVMEAAAGNIVYADQNYTMPKGLARAMAWQAIGHGADGYLFWTWRPTLNGVEQFHGSLTDPSGQPRPFYDEAVGLGREIKIVAPFLAQSTPVTNVMMLHDYPSRWALRRQPMTKDYDPWTHFINYYRAVRPLATGISIQSTPDNLSAYKLVVAPNLHVLSGEDAQKLTNYVRAGGHLVIGPRAGVKTETSSLWEPNQPGPLSALIGARVDQTAVLHKGAQLSGSLGTANAKVWAERLKIIAPDVTTLLTYAPYDGWLDNASALITRPFGRGRVTYIGAWLDDASLRQLLAYATKEAAIEPQFSGIPNGVEVSTRSGPMGKVHVVNNWNKTSQTVELPLAMENLLTGQTNGQLVLGAGEVAILRDGE
jgi:beta-galactosidase